MIMIMAMMISTGLTCVTRVDLSCRPPPVYPNGSLTYILPTGAFQYNR